MNVLVTFSGELKDGDKIHTEEKLNKTLKGETIKEKQLPEAFNSEDFGVLIVAEKYQTGFDERLLHTMFVDKKLSGVKAVQTLSRLNRTMQVKQDTFVDVLEDDEKQTFKTGLARFCRIYSFITQVCRMFEKEIHKFSIYAKFLLKVLPKDGIDKINLDDKVFLEFYKLEKDFEGGIDIEGTEEGFMAITGESGKKEKKEDPLTVIIEKINERFGTRFTEMDKVLMQLQNDYAVDGKWKSYAQNNDRKTFMLLFERDFPDMAANRYEQNEEFFIKMFKEPAMMKEVMGSLGAMIYDRLR